MNGLSRRTAAGVGVLLAAAFGCGLTPARGNPQPLDPGTLSAAIRRALPLIEKSSGEYTRKTRCFSCHHQAVGVLALSIVRERGFPIDEENFDRQVAHTRASLRSALANYQSGRGQGGGSTHAGYALWTLAIANAKPDETTQAVAGFLLSKDAQHGYWRGASVRPPTEGSAFTATAVSLLGLRAFVPEGMQEKVSARTAGAVVWARKAAATDNEDRVFRLLALSAAGDQDLDFAVRELREKQQGDGGWSQLDGQPADAYATGSALVALHRVGGLSPEEPTYRKGLQYLLRTQREDGTWFIKTRSRPIQQYFETGFPHGKDQFISMAGTCWATAALALACPPKQIER